MIPDNSVVMGSPGKVVKTLDESAEARLKMSALHYAEHFQHFVNLEPFQAHLKLNLHRSVKRIFLLE